ncbi:MAG: DNA polymerase I [Oligoflexia bacterium]|nr:DNA polymerase I [Oligoflexia bacterium]
MVEKKRLLFCLVDASSFIFRAYYAVRPLSNKDGLPTNAIFGFCQMIVKILEDLQPTHIAIVYDTKHPSFRKEMYAEYKANRGAMPDDLIPQIPYIKKFIEALGLVGFEKEGFEADDIIATFAEESHKLDKDAEVCIVSSDKDLMQLVNERVYLFDSMKNKKMGIEEVKEKFGVGPELVADYLGIVGDTSDNIPGVKGIGPKGASNLLNEFGSLENIYKNIDSIKKEKLKEQLTTSKDFAFLSKELATVKKDMSLDFSWDQLKCNPKPTNDFAPLMDELEFKGVSERVQKWLGTGPVVSISPKKDVDEKDFSHKARSVKLVLSEDDLKDLEQTLKSSELIAIDTETTGLHIRDDSLVGIAISSKQQAFYIPLGHTDEDGAVIKNQLSLEKVLVFLKAQLAGKKLTGHNLKFDLNILKQAGLALSMDQIYFDTLIASYLLEPNGKHGLDFLADKEFSHKMISFEDICGKGKEQIPFSKVKLETAAEYSGEDAYVSYNLAEKLLGQLKEIPDLFTVFEKIELPLLYVLAEMEWEGVEIDTNLLQELSEKFSQELITIEKKSIELAGEEFNLSSPKQLSKIFFEKLKLPVIKKTKTGFSTDVEVLEKLKSKHPLPKLILEHRELSKLKNTYIDVLPTLVSKKTGRVHAHFNQTVAATGRLSSSDPNLQNIPIRSESGQEVRRAFIARDGWSLIGADYSQVELRILASMSGDKDLCRAFQEGKDIHTMTAANVFSTAIEEVSPDQRRKAKAINFGILYGKSAFSLSEELEISRAEAAEIIDSYFAQYPTIRSFIDGLIDAAREKGYAETVFGRRRMIADIHAKNKMIKAMAERMAVNTPIQGTAADLIKMAMIDLAKALREEKMRSRLILQVHDELVLEVPDDEKSKIKKLLKEKMMGAGGSKIHVPLEIEVGESKNWLGL